MKTLLIILTLFALKYNAQDSLQLQSAFKIGAYVTNGFYNIKNITYGDYKTQGTQLSYGIHITYFPIKHFGIRFMSGYTTEEYVFQNYIENGNYWESPTMFKDMAYLDFAGALQYDLILKKKIQIGLSTGGGTGYLVDGKNVLTGIYGPDYHYFKGPVKQFNPKVRYTTLSALFAYSPTKHFAIEIEPIWRHNFGEVVTNQAFKNSFNILVGVSYRIKYP